MFLVAFVAAFVAAGVFIAPIAYGYDHGGTAAVVLRDSSARTVPELDLLRGPPEADGPRSGYDDRSNLARASARLDEFASATQAVDDVAAAGARGTTLHGTERIAGAGATRGGVLNSAGIAVVRGGGTAYAQSNGAIARVLQQANGRYSVVVDGNRGLITTFQNLSQNSLDRLAKNYGWTAL